MPVVTDPLGVRRVVVVQRNDKKEVRRERVRDWRRSGGRMAENALALSQGWQSGHYAI
ncbi:hypothetical protein [Mycolicibacterium pyrenivorans]|uniref:hypothetical protein n=1 Tax=Mycolicibacterium pyrenivorans TaxID=187102 RepID=UPI0021F3606F|nr:hypothetical protein [Mycolicibacterium pyrenivorans]MCV7150264.1 hypothetical protein [Mycolicibacterium pyrenivorans]